MADGVADDAIGAIKEAASTGAIGDGKIFAIPVDEVVRHPHGRDWRGSDLTCRHNRAFRIPLVRVTRGISILTPSTWCTRIRRDC